MPRLLLDLTPLQTAPFRRSWFGALLTGVGANLTAVAVGLQVYEVTGSTFSVGLVGLFALVPLIAMGLYGGAVVDAMDRRTVIIASALGTLVVAVGFVAQAAVGNDRVWVLYLLIGAQSGLFGIANPARSASIPRLLPDRLLPAANALTSLSFTAGMSVGPLSAGLLISAGGFGAAYLADAVLAAGAVLTLVGLPALAPTGPVQRAGLESVLTGFRFLATRPNVRMTFTLDLAAMVLAMPRVLFPAMAVLALGGGATTVGVLTAAFAIGSMAAGLLSGPLGAVVSQGRAVVLAIVVWGAAVSGFGVVVAASPGAPESGVSWLLWPAIGCLVVAGAADAVSAVFRMTILQAATPDELRGRLQGVFVVVVAGGPRLGDVVLGTAAALTAEATTAIGGGLACVLVVLVVALRQRTFLRYDARMPHA